LTEDSFSYVIVLRRAVVFGASDEAQLQSGVGIQFRPGALLVPV